MRRKTGLTHRQITEFQALKRIPGIFFTLAVGKATQADGKYACVVSKKVSGKAVVRNAIKRHCREAVRLQHAVLSSKYSFMLYAKSAAASASYQDIAHDIQSLFQRALGAHDDQARNSVYNSDS